MVKDRASVSCSIGRLECTKANGRVTHEVAEAWNATQTEIDTKATSLMASLMAKASILGLTARYMRASGAPVSKKVRVFGKASSEIVTSANGDNPKLQVTVSISGKTVTDSKESGSTA